MIDLQLLTLQLAQADAALVAGVASLTMGTDPPPSWTPGDGPAVVLNVQGGPAEGEGSRLWRSQVQIRAYGATETAAWDAYLLAHNALNEQATKDIISSQITVSGQLLPPEPDTRRIVVLAQAEVLARDLS